MHPFISHALTVQRIEQALSEAEAARRSQAARSARRHTHRWTRWVTRAA